MLGQVIATHEAVVTYGAGETFLPGVCPAVPGKFVRPSKVPVAALPPTPERLLT